MQLRTERIYEERDAPGCAPHTATVWRLVRADRGQMIRFARRWAEQHPLVEEEPARAARVPFAPNSTRTFGARQNDDPMPVADLTERLRVLEEGGAGPVNRVMNAQFFAKTCPSAEGPAPVLTAKPARRAERPPVEEESPATRVSRRSRWWMQPSRPLPPPSVWDGKVELADVQPSPLARRSSLNVHLLGIPAEQLPYNFSLAFE